jgi:uncharacterized protein involved in exopolysaccharide biosynthesis
MQMQPYQPQDLAPAGGERIHIPVTGSTQAASAPPPSLVTVFARESWKRKKLLFIWLGITAVLIAAIVLQLAQPLYRAEGKFAYQPNYRAGNKPVYTPPNIQSAVQILKSSETLDPVRAKHQPNMSATEFANNVRIEVSKQSEFIDVSYDHSDPKVAEAVANDLMQEGLKTFANVRVRTAEGGIAQVRQDRETAKKRLEEAKAEYSKAHETHGIADVQVEQINLQTALSDINSKIRTADDQKGTLTEKIRTLEARRDAPSDPSDSTDETLLSTIPLEMAKLQNELNNGEKLDNARIDLEAAKKMELEYRVLYRKGTIKFPEYNEVASQVKKHEATIKRAEQTKADYEALKKKYEALKNANGGKPVRRAVTEELERLKAEFNAIPGTLARLNSELDDKKKALNQLAMLQKELGPKEEEIRLLRTRLQDFDIQLTDAAERGQDLNANDLRVHSPATAGTTPHSTNAPKLGLAIFGASALLFVGYIALFALPRFTPGAVVAAPDAAGKPRALVALVPYMQPSRAQAANGAQPAATPEPEPAVHATAAAPSESNGTHPTVIAAHAAPPDAEPVTAWGDAVASASSNGTHPPSKTARRKSAAPAVETPPKPADADPAPVQVLADRISEDWVDRGGIVLFTPTADELKVAPAMGDLGRIFTEKGERVLVFDARHDAETPSWAGSRAPDVAQSVEGFLDGRAEAPAECFVSTDLNGVEYSRADLSTRVTGVMAVHRFRQLIEEMRERYSLVFLVGPPVSLDGGDPMLATLAEGMVLVTETSANPTEVHAYLETLSHQAPARVYGTLAVPKA